MADASARIESQTGFERTVAFSDGVFAIAITLLVLSLDVPKLGHGEKLDHALSNLADNFTSYFIGFAVIGLFWVGHHYFFDSLRGFDGRLLWLNLLYLSFIGLMPFTTALLGDYGNDPSALTAYAINVALAGLADTLMVAVALSAHLLEPQMQARGRELIARNLLPPAVFLASIPLAYVDTTLAKYSWLLLAVVPRVMVRTGVWNLRALGRSPD
jgi:TMEM175 potassium channel family protein